MVSTCTRASLLCQPVAITTTPAKALAKRNAPVLVRLANLGSNVIVSVRPFGRVVVLVVLAVRAGRVAVLLVRVRVRARGRSRGGLGLGLGLDLGGEESGREHAPHAARAVHLVGVRGRSTCHSTRRAPGWG